MVAAFDDNAVTIACHGRLLLLTCNDLVILIRMRVRIAFAAVLFAGNAWAQDAADLAMARTLGTEGLRLAESGNCAAAVDRLSRAEKLHHAPTTLERLGECEIAIGHFVDGTEDLRRVLRERIPEGSPSVFVTAQTRAKAALDQATPHLGKVRVDVAGPTVSDVVLKIDNVAVSNATIGAERPIDPGAHTVEANAPGFKSSSQRFDVADGGSRSVSLTLERAPEQPKPVAVEGTARHDEGTHTTTTPVTTTRRNYVPAIVAFGGAGAALAFGGIFGGLALSKKNDLVTACGGTTSCPPSQRSAFDDTKTFANLSTVGFVVAGITAAVGVVLVIVAPKHTVVVENVAVGVTPSGLFIGGAF